MNADIKMMMDKAGAAKSRNGSMSPEGTDLKHRDLTEKMIGVFYDVYNELGHGFLESVYQKAMEISLREAGLRVEREMAVPVWFRSRDVGNFKADLLVEGCVLLELKTAQAIDRTHEAQLMNYLRATAIEVGLLFNFGPKSQFRRFVFENEKKKIRVHPRESAVEQV
jgi:GxxExxY protein